MPVLPKDVPRNFGVFHLPLGSSLRDAGEKISRMEPGKFRGFEAFAYIYHEPIAWNKSEAESVTNYEPNLPHFVVDRDAGLERIRKISLQQFLTVETAEIRRCICESDLMDLMFAEGAACALEPSGNYHFVTPSLMHTDRFIRIGDLVRNRETLDRLAFWIEQRVANVQGVLVDSWSISAVALRALQKLGLNIPFDCIPEHPVQNPEACKAVIESLVRRMSGEGKLLVLVSINGSGQLLSQVESILEPFLEGISVENLSLYGFKSTPQEFDCLARIDDKGETHTDEACAFCSEGSIAIPIDSTSYHLRSWREQPVLLRAEHCNPGKSFINRYRSIEGLFFVHRNDPSDSRHHAYDIDVARLLELPEFVKKHRSILAGFAGKVDLLVCPDHAAAHLLLAIARDVLDVPYVIHDNLDRASLEAGSISALEDARAILVIDDTLNSGSRTHRYVQGIREGNYGEFSQINFHVALARPETLSEFNRISKSIADHHPWEGEMNFTEIFLLPRWGTDKCPWCKEFDLLSRLEESYGRPPDWLTKRTQLLRDTQSGISCEPLLLLPNVEPTTLGDGSPICAAGTPSMPLTFAIASALQRHRSDSNVKRQLHPDFPLANVLSPKNFERYDEGLIRAILLRNVTRHELGSQASIEIRDYLLAQMGKDNQSIVAGAIVIALGQRSFPPISVKTFKTHFGGFVPESDLDRVGAALGLPQPSTISYQ